MLQDYRIKEAEIADACTEKYPQESVSSSPVSSELLNKAIHDEDRVLVENNHTDANPLVEVAKDAKNSTCEEVRTKPASIICDSIFLLFQHTK